MSARLVRSQCLESSLCELKVDSDAEILGRDLERDVEPAG